MITKRNKYVKSIIVLTGIIVLALISGFTGCGSPTTQTTPAQTSDAGLSGTITESGSTTVQPLAEKWAGASQKMHPKVTVTIQGGGSGVGVKSAAAGTVDIGAASREITPEDPPVVKHLLCKDAITIIVSPANKLTDISKQQIIDIFSGKITNWSQLGGENKEIHVVAREEGSGTRGSL